TSTPPGTGTGIFPTRLMSPDLAHDLAAQPPTTRLPIGQQPLGRRHDRYPEPALDAGQLVGPPVHPVARLRDPADPADGRRPLLAVAKHQNELRRRLSRLDLVAVEEPLCRQQAGERL